MYRPLNSVPGMQEKLKDVKSVFLHIFTSHIYVYNDVKQNSPKIGTQSVLFPTSLSGRWLINMGK